MIYTQLNKLKLKSFFKSYPRKMDEAGFKQPNWPPFRPIVYHDIAKDIPQRGQPLMKQAFALWHSMSRMATL